MAQDGTRRRRGEAAVIAALLAGATYSEAAEAAGVGHRTVARWMTEPDFRGRVDQAKAEAVAAGRVRLLSLLEKAVNRVDALIDAGSESVALRASEKVIDLVTVDDLERRIASLEARLGDGINGE